MSEIITLRANYETKELITKTAKEYGTTTTNLLLECYFEQQKKVKSKYKKELKKLIKKHEFKKAIKGGTELFHYLYQIKNTLNTLMNLLVPGMFLRGQINWNVVKLVQKEHMKVWKTMPLYIRKALKPDHDAIMNLEQEQLERSCSNLLEKKTMQQIKKIEHKIDL